MNVMNHYEHAQHIYSKILAGWAASGRPLPSQTEAESYAKMAMDYAKAFTRANTPP